MNAKVSPQLDAVPLRNLKVDLERGEPSLHKVNLAGGKVLDQARFLAGIEPKTVANDTGLSHSLVYRALKSDNPEAGDIGFVRLWNAMPDKFWLELGMLILKTRGSRRVRHLFEVEDERKAG